MRWIKRDRWKAGITITGMLLLLVLVVWVPVSAAGAYEGMSGLATPVTGTEQATPTEDATVTALNKEKLVQEVEQLKEQNHWAWTTVGPILVGFAGLLAALYSFITWIRNRQDEQKKRDEEQKRWLKDQEAEREKRAEERFQAVVEGLGSERNEAKVGAAITLRTFLLPGYERFYRQVFDLAVAHLRLRKADASAPGPISSPAQVLIVPKGSLLHEQQSPPPTTSIPLDSLSQALITVFKEAFPLARSQNKGVPQSLDATGIVLDNAFFSEADLKQAWMPQASLRKAQLWKTNLNGADLREADLRETNLRGANLNEANLRGADLRGADLNRADLCRANLRGVNLIGVNLNEANLNGAYLGGDLFFKAADLSFAVLSGANLADAFLKDTNLYRVIGLTKEQLEACKAKGAIIDEDSTTSSLQSTVAPSPPAQSNEAQASSAQSAQGSLPPPDPDGSSTVSSQQEPEP